MRLSIKFKMALLLLIVVITVGVVGVMSIREMNNLKDVSLTTQEQQIRDNFDKNIKEQVENACTMLKAVNKKAESGEYTKEQAQKIGADLLREMRFGTDGYFWADTYDGLNIVLLGNSTEGTNRIGLKDANGVEMVKEIIKVGREANGGYFDYHFPKAGTTDPLPKRSYSKAFEPFGWVVGTGNYTDFIDTYIANQKATIEKGISASIAKMIMLIAICLIAACSLGIYIVLSIVLPLKKFIKITDNLANGNLDTDVDVKSKDEIGQLATSMHSLVVRLKTYIVYIDEISDLLNEMGNGNLNLSFNQTYDGDFRIIKDALSNTSDMLNHTLTEFNVAASQVSSGSDQVSSGAQALSQGATEQASSIEELSATINDISAQIKQSADNAAKAKEITIQANTAVSRGQQQMRDMVGAMNEINNTSNQIGKIIKNIDDIAFQTNILALNAAVEAARAGAAGKGFAVVADEVRSLASKSAESAKNTSALIESSLAAINKGTKIVAETAKALDEVVSNSEKSAEIIQYIADASAEQASSITQVNIGFEQIAGVVQMNSATAEESAAASEELSSQAQMLSNLISKFKLKETEHKTQGLEYSVKEKPSSSKAFIDLGSKY